MNWDRNIIKLDSGESSSAIFPIIISASRSTDIPAFYSEWLMNRINKGYVAWVNPFNKVKQYVSFDKTRLIIFWSKNPEPMISNLEKLDKFGINYYFQYTLNDYFNEGLEPNVPSLDQRINTFKKISNIIGKEKIIWRFDPLILSDKLDVNILLEKVENIGNKINKYTNKLVFSFADINIYKKVSVNLYEFGNYKEFNNDNIIDFAKGIYKLNKNWKLSLATCCENLTLKEYGIENNRCIDDELIVELFHNDEKLMDWIGYHPDYKTNSKLKDIGQRKSCGCIFSKDIGMYNTCSHFCRYCYSNHSNFLVEKNVSIHNKFNESII